MRLIDADALKESVPNTSADVFENCRNCKLLDDWQVKELIDNAPTVEPASPWHRVEDGLPVKGEIVIVSDGKHTWDIGQYHCLFSSDDRTKWWWKGHTIKTVKWWMRKKDALPEPPKEE